MSRKEIQVIIVSFLLGCIIMLGISKKIDSKKAEWPSKTNCSCEKSLSKAIDQIYDAVVVVQGYEDTSQKTTGSGFFYKEDGYILTNEHVIRNMDSVKVILTTDEEVEAEVLGSDEFLDLAVLKVEKKYVIKVAKLGKSEDMKIGDPIFTMGAPMGIDYKGSVTSGIISGKDRMVSLSSNNIKNWQMRVLQIDAAINPGSSGGPLLNNNGEVIGICTMKLIDNEIEGMGFAIPIEYALSHLKSLESKEEIKWPIFGIEMINASDKTALARNEIEMKKDVKKGVVVLSVKDNSTASSTNLQKGDIIIKVEDIEVKNTAHFRYLLYQYQVGDKINITYIHNQKEIIENVILKD